MINMSEVTIIIKQAQNNR